MIRRAHLGEEISTIEDMGAGQMVRRGVSAQIPNSGSLLVVVGKYLPQNFAEKINTINAYVNRYRQGKLQKNDLKTFYLMTLIFVTLLIVFAASWIGFHIARGITVPIEKLARATKEVSRGNLDIRVEDSASDEIGDFIDSFNQMLSDIQENRRNIAQKTGELEGRRRYIETILDNITTGLISLDAEHRITTINPSAREMLELDKADLLGRDIREILGDSRFAEISRLVEQGIQGSAHLQEKEVKINLSTQTVTLAVTMSPLRRPGASDSGVIIVLDNLTQLIHAQKIAAWQEVAQRVAHEIKNPLTPIQLSAERIIKRLRREERAKDDIIEEGAQAIIQEAGTIKALVDEFSNFARMPKIQLKTADLHEIIQLSVSPFKGIYTEISFETEFSDEIPSPIRLDPEHIRRVFINLIDNAIDAMNKQGVITIRTEYDARQERVRIEVGDTGPGIPDEDKPRLFLPHFSTKKKGTGLGLAIVRQIITEHNGTIHVEDNKPLGAKFIIQVPK
jgi:two-component system nitrogen regulation sensor histidine kinase NtrY